MGYIGSCVHWVDGNFQTHRKRVAVSVSEERMVLSNLVAHENNKLVANDPDLVVGGGYNCECWGVEWDSLGQMLEGLNSWIENDGGR